MVECEKSEVQSPVAKEEKKNKTRIKNELELGMVVYPCNPPKFGELRQKDYVFEASLEFIANPWPNV